eukprot:g3084.t1
MLHQALLALVALGANARPVNDGLVDKEALNDKLKIAWPRLPTDPPGSGDNWRWLFSPGQPCDCHGNYPTTWGVPDACTNINGTDNGVKFQSVRDLLR